MPDAEKNDVGCGQVQSVRTQGIALALERPETTAKGVTVIVRGDNVDPACVLRILSQDSRQRSLCWRRKGEANELGRISKLVATTVWLFSAEWPAG